MHPEAIREHAPGPEVVAEREAPREVHDRRLRERYVAGEEIRGVHDRRVEPGGSIRVGGLFFAVEPEPGDDERGHRSLVS